MHTHHSNVFVFVKRSFVKRISQSSVRQRTMSIYFDFLDAVTPLTPAMTKTMLEEAFACGYETVDHNKANAIVCNINWIQENMTARTLDWTNVWHLFESDPNFGPWEEAFPWVPPGFSMLMSMTWLKKKLFTKLYPDIKYVGSIMDATLVWIWMVQEQRAMDENLDGHVDEMVV